MKRGFTLIELLIVVLIIGVLTAIALPQYEKAVEKAKAVKMLALFKAVVQANEAYSMETGDLIANNFDVLGVSLPADFTGTNTNKASNGEWELYLTTDNTYGWREIVMEGKAGSYKGTGFMYTKKTDGYWNFVPLNQLLCYENPSFLGGDKKGNFCQKIFQGTYLGNSGWNIYSLPY